MATVKQFAKKNCRQKIALEFRKKLQILIVISISKQQTQFVLMFSFAKPRLALESLINECIIFPVPLLSSHAFTIMMAW